VPAVLDGYQSAAGSIFQRTASAEPDLPSAYCDPVPSLAESSDSGGVCFLSCWWSLFSFLDSFYTNRVTLRHIRDSGHSLVPADLVFITDHWLGDLECLDLEGISRDAHALYVAQRLLEGEKYVK